jgi:hypothetical protein
VNRPNLCTKHLTETWNNQVQKMISNENWLREAMKHPRGGNVVLATNAKLKQRVRDGTYRACPCGADVLPSPAPAVPPAPRVWFCMGCMGYRFMTNTRSAPTMPYGAPRPAVLAPGVAAPRLMRPAKFDHIRRRWNTNVIRRFGRQLSGS